MFISIFNISLILTTNFRKYIRGRLGSEPPRNKLLIYHRYVLGKIYWHLTVTNISVTWVKENLDNMVQNYVRSWLELPVSETLKIDKEKIWTEFH